MSGRPGGSAGFSRNRATLPVGVGVDDAELVGLLLRGTRMPGDGHAGAGLHVLVDHLPRVHAVDVVGAEHDDDVGPLVVDEVEALEDRVGAAGVPARAEPLLRRHRGDVVAEQLRHPPGRGDVPVEASGYLYCVSTDDPPDSSALTRLDSTKSMSR